MLRPRFHAWIAALVALSCTRGGATPAAPIPAAWRIVREALGPDLAGDGTTLIAPRIAADGHAIVGCTQDPSSHDGLDVDCTVYTLAPTPSNAGNIILDREKAKLLNDPGAIHTEAYGAAVAQVREGAAAARRALGAGSRALVRACAGRGPASCDVLDARSGHKVRIDAHDRVVVTKGYIVLRELALQPVDGPTPPGCQLSIGAYEIWVDPPTRSIVVAVRLADSCGIGMLTDVDAITIP